MRKWIFLVIIIVAGILQVAVLDYFKIFGVKPDLFLITVIILSLFLELRLALILSIFAGILKDAFSLNSFAINTLMLPLWSFLTVKLSKRISIDNNLILGSLLFIIVILNNIIIRLAFIFLNKFSVPLGIFLRITFLESLYTAIISLLVFRIIKRVLLKEEPI